MSEIKPIYDILKANIQFLLSYFYCMSVNVCLSMYKKCQNMRQ